MKQQPKLLITGASGFTGEHACRHFAALGFHVTAVTRGKQLVLANIQVAVCQLNCRDEVNQLIDQVKPDYLLHLAAVNHVGKSWADPVTTIEANVLSTLYLVDAIRRVKPFCRIIVVGSALQQHQSSRPSHPYALSKNLQERLIDAWVRLFDMDIVIAKPSNLIGPGRSNGVSAIFARQIVLMERQQAEAMLEVNNLAAKRDFIDVRDVVCGYEVLFANGKAGGIYDISTGGLASLGEMLAVYQRLSTLDFEVHSAAMSTVDDAACVPPIALTALGWRQTISLVDSLRDTLDYYRLQVGKCD